MGDVKFWKQFGIDASHGGDSYRSTEELAEKNHSVYLKRKENGKQRTYRETVKAEVLAHYGGGVLACVACGYSDLRALSIDHIDGRDREEKEQGFWLWLKLRKANYPSGYQTLCMNCQWIKKYERKEFGDGGKV